MKCPFCENLDTGVVDSRDALYGKVVRRRRECSSCKIRFTTYERPELLNIQVVKRDTSKESYKREKLEEGIKKALEKRPVSDKKVEELVDSIESRIFSKNKTEVKSKEIGGLVVEYLKEIDEVAYLRFISVYRSFGSLASFDKEIKRLKKNK
ncbi:MAG: transcriptional repressor NrdR [Candidatus Moranbacteria bacterium]|nr:transcriptional repressor NrdR [Candidatus Moranbacteria bacterium]